MEQVASFVAKFMQGVGLWEAICALAFALLLKEIIAVFVQEGLRPIIAAAATWLTDALSKRIRK